jgi:hypothetical protein
VFSASISPWISIRPSARARADNCYRFGTKWHFEIAYCHESLISPRCGAILHRGPATPGDGHVTATGHP